MQFSLDCYPCALRHTLQVLRHSGADEQAQTEIMRQVLRALAEVDPFVTAPEFTGRMHDIIRAATGVEDIYKEAKQASTQEALALYPRLKKEIEQSSDPFETAVRLSIAGNIIDLGAADTYDLEGSIQRVLTQPFAINHLDALRQAIGQAGWVLYLADNAGETVFDRLLIERLEKPVVYAVKDAPVLNDATREDARMAGLDEVTEIISCGARTPGTLLAQCSADFIERFRAAEVIIAKGMGNFEALSTENAPLFFLLQVKCDMVGGDIGAPAGSIVVKGQRISRKN